MAARTPDPYRVKVALRPATPLTVQDCRRVVAINDQNGSHNAAVIQPSNPPRGAMPTRVARPSIGHFVHIGMRRGPLAIDCPNAGAR